MNYKDAIEMYKKFGADPTIFLSDWCVSCFYAYEIEEVKTKDADEKPIRIGVCGTGCNGVLPFNINNNGKREYKSDTLTLRIKPVTFKINGKVVVKNVPVPICYEESFGVEM